MLVCTTSRRMLRTQLMSRTWFSLLKLKRERTHVLFLIYVLIIKSIFWRNFHVILYAHNKDALNLLRRIITYDVREREKCYFTLYILDYWECNKIVYTSTWLNHSCNSSLYWDILLPIHRRWWQYFNWVCILVCVSQLCQKVYIQVIIWISYFF